MKRYALSGEKPIVAHKLTNGICWLTTQRLIIEEEKHNPHLNIMEKQAPKTYPLQDLKKTEIKGETLTAHFKESGKAQIRLQLPTPEGLQKLKTQIEQASEILRITNTLKR